jgi:hypothetical protein
MSIAAAIAGLGPGLLRRMLARKAGNVQQQRRSVEMTGGA